MGSLLDIRLSCNPQQPSLNLTNYIRHRTLHDYTTRPATLQTHATHHQNACFRVLLPVRWHDCHQHHLHRLRPLPVQRLPGLLSRLMSCTPSFVKTLKFSCNEVRLQPPRSVVQLQRRQARADSMRGKGDARAPPRPETAAQPT